MCKFTPLGFETTALAPASSSKAGVNLPRWGLKRPSSWAFRFHASWCKFTPLGFETFD